VQDGGVSLHATHDIAADGGRRNFFPIMGVSVTGLSIERHIAMAATLYDPETETEVTSEELRDHVRTFHSFSKLVLFAILHIMIVLSCLALAFLGNAPLMAIILGVGGTAALLAAFAITA
jgi:hypothetical protein